MTVSGRPIGLADNAVTTPKIADSAVTSAKIADGTITNTDVSATAAIAPTKILNTAVTRGDTGTVTSAMLAGSIAPSKVTGTAVTAADTGTVTSAMLAGGIAVTKVTAGTNGQVLSTNGSTVQWQDPHLATAYYISPTGSDAALGTSASTPWQTPTNLNATTLLPGDSVLFEAGKTFPISSYAGTTFIASGVGTAQQPITISTYNGTANAEITGVKQITGGWSLTSSSAAVGETSIRSLNGALLNGFMQGSMFIFPSAGTVASIVAYIDGNGGGASTQPLDAVIYADTAGSPTGAPIAVSTSVNVTAGQVAGWVTFTFSSPPHLAVGTYHLAIQAGGTTNTGRIFYDNTAGFTTDRWNTTGSTTFGSPPTNPTVAVTAGDYSIYANFTPDVTNTYQSAYTGIIPTGATAGPTGVWATGGSFTTKTSLTHASSVGAMTLGTWFWSSNILYVNVGGNPDSLPVTIETSWYDRPFKIANNSGYINVSNLTIAHGQLQNTASINAVAPVNWSNCTIKYCGDGGGTGGGFPGAVYLQANPKGGRITGCTFTGNLNDNLYLYCKSTANCANYEIDNNDFVDLGGATSDHIQIDVTEAANGSSLGDTNIHHNTMNSKGSDSPKGNFLISSSSTHTVTDCHFHHNICRYGRFGCSIDVCSKTLCEYNEFYNIGDDGTGTYPVNWPAAVYISQLSNDSSTSRHNLMVRCNRAYSFLDPTTGVTNFHAYNDTIIDCHDAIAYVTLSSTGSGTANSSWKNLVIYQSFAMPNVMFRFATNGTSGFTNVTLDYNDYARLPNASANWYWLTTNYGTLSTWQAASGSDAHSFVSDPKFVGQAEDDYRILPGSPARNAGTPIAGDAYIGSAPDMGYYEYLDDPTLAPESPLPPSVLSANGELVAQSAAGATATAALTPTFYPIRPHQRNMTLIDLAALVTATEAASTVGVAVYSINYTAGGTFTATRVAHLNASLSGSAATGLVKGAATSGTAGASMVTVPKLNFATTQYVIGVMTSSVSTLALASGTVTPGLGALKWTAAARSSVTDWPASFTQSSAGAISTSRIHWAGLLTADGVNWI